MTKKKTLGLAVLLVAISLFAPTGGALASGNWQTPEDGDRVVIGDDLTIHAEETINGDVLVIGGDFELEETARVSGDVITFGGATTLAGRVDGTLLAIGSDLTITGSAGLLSDAIAIGGDTDNVNELVIAGNYATLPGPSIGRLSFAPFYVGRTFKPQANSPAEAVNLMLQQMLRAARDAVVVTVLAGLILLMWPVSLTRVRHAINDAPGATGGIGVLTGLLFPILAGLLVATFVLLPVGALILALFAAVALLGWIGLGMLAGERLLAWFGRHATGPVESGLAGVFGLTLILGIIGALPGLVAITWVARFLLASPGMGAVILTRFGRQTFRRPAPLADDVSPPKTIPSV